MGNRGNICNFTLYLYYYNMSLHHLYKTTFSLEQQIGEQRNGHGDDDLCKRSFIRQQYKLLTILGLKRDTSNLTASQK